MDQEFQTSVDLVKKGTPKINVDNKTKLQFYGLYKQATVGDINTPQPGFFEPVGKAKWNSWRSKKGMTKDEAMKQYIELSKRYY
tara:strand:+ start:456 stop:707 length:252 start_codon:yes stop_codon:yes gene_type:complete